MLNPEFLKGGKIMWEKLFIAYSSNNTERMNAAFKKDFIAADKSMMILTVLQWLLVVASLP